MKKILIAILFTFISYNAYAACTDNGLTLAPDTLSQSDVQACVTAAEDGDTIILPAGAITWSAAVVVGGETSRTKMVKFEGAGTDASTGTRITCTGRCFTIWLDHDISAFEISEIRIIAGSGNSTNGYAVWLGGHADTYETLFRIHNIYFDNTNADDDEPVITIGGTNSYNAAYEVEAGVVRPYIWGLIDNNTFAGDDASNGVEVDPRFDNDEDDLIADIRGGTEPYGYSNEGNAGWRNWTLEDHQGTWKNVFIEDNLVDYDAWGQDGKAWYDSNSGGTAVIRFNTIWNNWIGGHGIYGGGGRRAYKWIELYRNIFVLDDSSDSFYYAHGVRGANGILYSNYFYDASDKGTYSISGSYSWKTDAAFLIYYYRSDLCCKGHDYGTTNCDNVDEDIDNQDDSTGYICADQAGSAWDDGISDFVSRPVVNWDNRHGGASGTERGLKVTSSSDHIKEERDFLQHDTCSDSTDNDSDGNTDMSDAACSTWWDDTDNNRCYDADGNKTADCKKIGYTPYTYPHPLRGENPSQKMSGTKISKLIDRNP